MLNFEVDKENKIVKCVISGKEVANYANKLLKEIARDYKASAIMFKDVYISDTYIGVAKYHDNESAEWNEITGKMIAKRKAFRKLNKAVVVKLQAVLRNLEAVQENTLFMKQKFEGICQELDENLREC